MAAIRSGGSRTQGGNNNTYCQDSELSWIDWELPEQNSELLKFAGALVAFRRVHPVLRRRKWSSNLSVERQSPARRDGPDRAVPAER
jgi:pullulanase/glycogen debranching enzyme